ncbi:junctional adhesion molecule C-like isoform X1 [Styela clava]
MGLLLRIISTALLIQATFGVRVSLENGQTGTAIKTEVRGQSVLLKCSATASVQSGEPSLEWLYSTVPNSAGTHIYYQNKIVDGLADRFTLENPYSIVIKDLVSADTGFYTCRVVIPGDNPSVGSGMYNFTVYVPPHPQISCGFPSDLKITVGHQASFHCREQVAQAVPAPVYTWYKNGIPMPLAPGNDPRFSNSSFTYSSETGILTFSSVKAGDAGTYQCEAKNAVGSEKCNAAEITTKEQDIGAIVGIVFAVIFALLLIGVLVWWTWKKGYCDGWFDEKDHDEEDAPDDGANDIMLDGAGPLVTKEPSEWSNGTSNKNSVRSSGRNMPDGAVRVML